MLEMQMYRCGIRRAASVLALALPFMGMAGTASGVLILDIQNGANVIVDNGPGDAEPLVTGRIVNSSTVAGFGIAITVATSNSPGSPVAGVLQVQSLDVQNLNAGPASLGIRVSDTNFTLPGTAGALMTLNSSVGGTFTLASPADTVGFQSFSDPANGQPAGAVSTAPLSFLASGSISTESFSGQNSTAWTRGAGPYSLANQITMTLTPGAQMNISGTTTAIVPEPAALVGLLAIMPALAVRRRR